MARRYFDARTEAGLPIPHSEIKSEILLVLFAGADTTGNALLSLVLFVLHTPGVYARIVTELAAAAPHFSAPPKYDEVAAHAPFLVACVRETLRLRPPVYGALPRIVGKDGLQVGAWRVPPGTEVASSVGLANRDPRIYGADADEFRPERWLDEARAWEYEKYSFTWGYGSRVCLGKYVAYMELYKSSAQVS